VPHPCGLAATASPESLVIANEPPAWGTQSVGPDKAATLGRPLFDIVSPWLQAAKASTQAMVR
jgi:hypothetical protein